MSKKCSSCGFQNNPDNANCCGKCGKDLINSVYRAIWGRIPDGADRYRVYDSYSYTCITKSRYDTLCNAEKELNRPLWKQQINLIKKFWEYSTFAFWKALKKIWEEDADKWVGLLPLLIILGFVIFVIVRGCSTDTKQLSRIKVDNKYGIGYSENELLIPAEYDSISSGPIGNQWFLYDLSTSLCGVAYVNDSVRNVIPTEFSDIVVGGNHAILKKYIDNSQKAFLAVDGVIINKSGYESITYPGQYLSTANVLIVKDANNKSFLIDKGGQRLNRDYSRIKVSNDSIIIASDDLKSYTRTLHTIFDYEGKRLTNKTFTRIRDFSDGVAWCTITETDARLNRWYIIDNHGNIIYHTFAKYGSVKDFKDGIGWFQKIGNNKGSSKFVAVNKKGRELFEIEAYQVYPYSLGLAPVYKGTSYSNKKLGFINEKGETVIPFKYQAKYSSPEFGRDSLMDVRLNGVEGKLHRNGKFFPK